MNIVLYAYIINFSLPKKIGILDIHEKASRMLNFHLFICGIMAPYTEEDRQIITSQIELPGIQIIRHKIKSIKFFGQCTKFE